MRRASARPRLALVAVAVARLLAPAETPAQEVAPSAPPAETATPDAREQPPAEPSPAEPPAGTVPQPSAPAPEAAPTGAGPEPPARAPKEDTWLDTGHAFIEQRIFAPVLRLDRFFSDERDLEAQRSRSFLRWRSEIRFTEHRGKPAYATGVSANLRLPGLDKRLERLRIVIEGETRNTFAALFPTGTPEAEVEETTGGAANAELRFRFWETVLSHADLGAGLLFRLPPGAFGRTRLRLVLPVKKLLLTRWVATGFWRTDTHLGTSASTEAERPLGPKVIARLMGNATVTQRSKGIEWSSDFAFLTSFDVRSAAQFGVAVNGATRARPALDRWRVYARMRRDFYRRWLFFEIEPDVSWPWTADLGRHRVLSVAGRLEIQFQGKERPPPPPPPLPREPEDPPPEDPPPEEALPPARPPG